MSADDAVQVIADLFASEGATEYLGEPVTQAAHLLQAAALAERDRAEDALIAAALVHDVGHFAGAVTGHDLARRGRGRLAGPVVRRGGHRAGPAARRREALPLRGRA
jgi:gamma-butyrobetaine dioxygenase